MSKFKGNNLLSRTNLFTFSPSHTSSDLLDIWFSTKKAFNISNYVSACLCSVCDCDNNVEISLELSRENCHLVCSTDDIMGNNGFVVTLNFEQFPRFLVESELACHENQEEL